MSEPRKESTSEHEAARDRERVDSRAELLPEERAAGSEDPREQAEVILAESEERTERPAETQRASVQSPDPS